MKICAISPFESATRTEILKFISRCNHDIIILPGNAKNHPTPQSVAKVLKKGIFAFVETGRGKGKSIPCLVSSMQQIKMPSQCFARTPKATDLDNLQSIWHLRTHKIGNRKFSFAICGEIDGFKKDASVKYGRNLPYDILINPTHTIRGRFNHLGIKLKNLSAGTVVIHVANNDRNHHRLITDIRIYINGKVQYGKRGSDSIRWSECEI